MKYTLPQLQELFKDYLASLRYEQEPKGLYDPINYELDLGGKRLRPLLLMLAYHLYKDDVMRVLPQAAGIETYHNFTLLHDDVMDKADRRRGKLTVHRFWNENTAILSGDAMTILAYKLMTDCDEAHLKSVLNTFNELALGICEGQQWDMDFETRSDVTAQEYLHMIRLKTSVLLAGALKIGAILGDAPEEGAQNLYDFGIKMGLAFQLQDDYLDVYGDPSVFGKNIGGDILCNKKTYMLIMALQMADDGQRRTIRKWLDAKDYQPAEKISEMTAVYNNIGVGEICLKKIDELYGEGLQILDEVKATEGRKELLKNFSRQLMKRKL